MYKDTANSLLEQNICNEVFDLDWRKVEPRNYVTGRWVLTINTDLQGNSLKANARWGTERFPGRNRRNISRPSRPASTRPGFRMSCQMAFRKDWIIFTLILRHPSSTDQSYDVSRDDVCQLPSEAGHPPHIAAKLKKPAYGMNEAVCHYGMVSHAALIRCCNVLCSTQSRERTWK